MNTQEFIENLKVLDKSKTDFITPINEMSMIDHNHIGINGIAYPFEKSVVKQLLLRMNAASGKHNAYNFSETMLLNFPDLLVHNMNYLLNDFVNHNYEGNTLVRLYSDRVRCMLSETYGVVNNSQILEYFLTNLTSITDKMPRLLKDSFYNENEMIFKCLIEEKDEGGLGVGLCLMNNETGTGSFKIRGLIKRFSCDNSIVVSGKISVNHTKGIYDKLEIIMSDVIQYLDLAIKARIRFNVLKDLVIPTDKFVLLGQQFIAAEKLKKDLFLDFSYGSEMSMTCQGFINGITHMAKSLQPEKRVEIEEKAGALLWLNVNELYKEYAVK